MLRDVIVEIIPGNPCRLIYSNGDFNLHCLDEIIMPQVFSGFSGWIKGYGAPPESHVTGLYLTTRPHDYGEEITGQVIGGIHCQDKYIIIFIDPDRKETSLEELKSKEQEVLVSLSPCHEWLSKASAIEYLEKHKME